MGRIHLGCVISTRLNHDAPSSRDAGVVAQDKISTAHSSLCQLILFFIFSCNFFFRVFFLLHGESRATTHPRYPLPGLISHHVYSRLFKCFPKYSDQFFHPLAAASSQVSIETRELWPFLSSISSSRSAGRRCVYPSTNTHESQLAMVIIYL